LQPKNLETIQGSYSEELEDKGENKMGKKIYTEGKITISQLIDKIEEGKLVLPSIQRNYVWSKINVVDLIDSIYWDYPTGQLTFMEFFDGAFIKDTFNINNNDDSELFVIDGQQRLSTLYVALTGESVEDPNLNEICFSVGFDPFEEKFYPLTKKNTKGLVDIKDVFEVENLYRLVTDYISGKEVAESIVGDIHDRFNQLRNNLKNYSFPTITIIGVDSTEAMLEFFRRTNMNTKKLSRSDLLTSNIACVAPTLKRHIDAFCRDCTPKMSPNKMLFAIFGYSLFDVDMHKILNRLNSDNSLYEKILKDSSFVLNPLNFKEFVETVDYFILPLRAILMSTFMFAYTVYLIGKKNHTNPTELSNIIKRWFFAMSLTKHHSSITETIFGPELKLYRGVTSSEEFIKVTNKIIDSVLLSEDVVNTFIKAVESNPTKNIEIYTSALLILDSPLFLSRNKLLFALQNKYDKKRSAELHHIFPREYLKKELNISDNIFVNHIANFAFVNWDINTHISDKSPVTYWQEYVQILDKDLISEIEELHSLPKNWPFMDYYEFLKERTILMANVVKKAYDILEVKEHSIGSK
jgi:hypothetical protein